MDDDLSVRPLDQESDSEPMSKLDIEYEKIILDAKWHALASLCEVIKLGKADEPFRKLAIAIATQIAKL